MELSFSAQDEAFRLEVRTWLEEALADGFEHLRGRGHLGEMDVEMEGRLAWERKLAEGGWTCVAWPEEHGGRGLSLYQEVIFYEEYARARAPGRVNHIGEHLLGPTLLHHGTPEQQERFLPGIRAGTEIWCQGYSEPNAGSDLANVQTRAVPDGDEWVIDGQKVWTSLASWSQWCFVLCRTDPGAERKHKGISCLLVPMDQPGVRVRPIKQITGSAEFAEVFFEGARTSRDMVVGPENGGWRVAMGTLAIERGASTLGQQLMFDGELSRVIEVAKETGAAADPAIRDRIADLWMRLRVMRLNNLRTLSAHNASAELPPAAMITKLVWGTWHRDLGELAYEVLGHAGRQTTGPDADHLSELQRLYLWSRSDTIYGGTNEIQRNIIATRALGLPRK